MLPPHESLEFGIILSEIVKELEKDEATNLALLKATLTIWDNSDIRVFSDKELEEIQACDRVRTLLTFKLRHCYRWDDFSFLTKLMSSINSEKCINLLETFKVKIESKLKLQQIYEQGKQKRLSFTEEYHKIVVILNNDFFKITKEEHEKLKYFISDQCNLEDYVISPLIKDSSSLFVSNFIV